MSKKKVIFICRGNSCRSQMAEGFARKMYGDQWEAHSAGTVPEGVNPNAMSVMNEVGIDDPTAKRGVFFLYFSLKKIDWDYHPFN